MQYKCICSIIARRHAAALGMRGQPMLRLYMSADGEGRPDWAWMAAFVWVLISRFLEVRRLPAPRRRGPRSAPPGCARRPRCARAATHGSATSAPASRSPRPRRATRHSPGCGATCVMQLQFAPATASTWAPLKTAEVADKGPAARSGEGGGPGRARRACEAARGREGRGRRRGRPQGQGRLG